ncbi:efflux RND transporter periplasmic adaptor subunit [Aquabacter cavernae]|uniref:efflux RND transporter periplasmic adaptor subunit n=1 Tax=Aquabacter cavernae TaxID=2496029 RepID=UPI001FE02933|nr:efflux RND transporter periplasmic adaptor subunit [Aquabacter cavernae]
MVAAFSVVAGLMVAGCNQKNQYVAPPPAKVVVAPPVQAPVTLYAEFTGNSAAASTVTLEARVQGFLTAIDYADGEAVKKGRVLFEIEQAQYQAQVDLQKAQLESAKATEENSRRQYERQAALGLKEVSSQRQVEDAKTTLDTARAQVAASEANLKLAETSLAYTTIRAPFDGVVTRHLVDVGALVGSTGATKLATILQVDPIYIYFTMSEQQQIDMRDSLAKMGKTLKSLREEELKMPVEVALSAEQPYQYSGRIDYVAPNLETGTGTLQMRAALENKDVALVPGMFVRVRVPVGKIETALLVNDTAVLSNQVGSYVLVVGANNVVEQRQVETGPVEGQLRVITKGLSATDKVVIGSIQRAGAGTTVSPVEGAMAERPKAASPAANAPAAASGKANP